MLTLINTNRMVPPIAPLGVEYVAGGAVAAGLDAEVLDLCLADDPAAALARHFATRRPDLVGLSFRNTDDSCWPSAESFLPQLAHTVAAVRSLTDAPIVLGGVGFSIFAARIVERFDVDFGIRGDGEAAVAALHAELTGARRFDLVPGLVWKQDESVRANPPAWPASLALPTRRNLLDNAAYFRAGGQLGLETKRGCNRRCSYCADPLAKGASARVRRPAEVADEVESLLAQGVDVLHLCDGEFNIPLNHAVAVCEELIRRSLGDRVRWYTYMAVTPFDAALAGAMRRAGCAGINFTGDAAAEAMLRAYRQPHRRENLADAVRLCRENGMAVMIDLLLGGPGETPETVAETIAYLKEIGPDCVGAATGVRLYPGTPVMEELLAAGPIEDNPGLCRKYEGPVDLLQPTFYVSPALGERPARLVQDLIAGDQRFFEPLDPEDLNCDADGIPVDHNYNANAALAAAIAAGARGAYWDILRRLRNG